MAKSRIPTITGSSRKEAFMWFTALHARGMLFCLDENPQDLFKISDGSRLFTDEESVELVMILEALFAKHGDELHGLAFEVLSRTFHTREERRAFKSMYG